MWDGKLQMVQIMSDVVKSGPIKSDIKEREKRSDVVQ
jgi:hypothetical protein